MFSNGGVLIFMTISTAITLSCSPESFRNYWQNQ
uniref:PGG domain-containing protein n=1 Tax=Aegilops tauschii subsp. strangulata TaxID=200361 RepID=A0A453JZ16_AEGTS